MDPEQVFISESFSSAVLKRHTRLTLGNFGACNDTFACGSTVAQQCSPGPLLATTTSGHRYLHHNRKEYCPGRFLNVSLLQLGLFLNRFLKILVFLRSLLSSRRVFVVMVALIDRFGTQAIKGALARQLAEMCLMVCLVNCLFAVIHEKEAYGASQFAARAHTCR